ncbi:DUF1579 domain-containing protein [Formosa maritima]|uniref:DUF1579 domain-containing protein n=1 Tax=Formosa maritima TaxID=2592046 RepID=A0A5D0GBS6_9FLAO|nr:DUF1579 domain-containing protein [Formosa maritima]TYA56314.1 DUF1579 domain-containing protein [Formosa maritima]
MKKLIITNMCLLVGITAFSQTPEEMKAWQENMTPGEQHKWLASMNGQWDATVKMWMDPTSQEPNISKASTTNEMIMGGLYQRSSHSGNMMGQPFMGESITGYDKAQKKFLATWIDNFGSSIMFMEGEYNTKADNLTLEGKMIDPATGKEMHVKEVITKTSEDSHKFEMFIVENGKDLKNMEITYTRKK